MKSENYGESYSGNNSSLERHVDSIDKFELFTIASKLMVSNTKLSSEEYKNLINTYIGAIKNDISKTLNRSITPYLTQNKWSTNTNIGESFNIYFFLGKDNWRTKNFGKYIASSKISLDNKLGITENDIIILDSELFKPIKTISDSFSKMSNLECIFADKQMYMESELNYIAKRQNKINNIKN
jgi:hypothetical protein